VEAEQLVQHAGRRKLACYRSSTDKFADYVLLIVEDIAVLAADPFTETASPGG
jgi:hypothetical protein